MINFNFEYPEWIIKMIDYQYSDEMMTMMNWGEEGVTYEIKEDGTKDFTESVYNQEDPDPVSYTDLDVYKRQPRTSPKRYTTKKIPTCTWVNMVLLLWLMPVAVSYLLPRYLSRCLT